MKRQIDCLLIGHNETDFEVYEQTCRKMGVYSGNYRDLNLNFLLYNNKPYTAAGMFNLLNNSLEAGFEPLTVGEPFSAAVSYLGSYLYKNGLQFDYVNSFQENKARLADLLVQEDILTIAIITTLYVLPLPIIEVVDFIRQYNRKARIIVGGPFVSTQVRTLGPEELAYLWNTIDADFYVKSSQGEATLVKIIQTLKNQLAWEGIENIHYKMNGTYTAAPLKQEDNPLSANPVNWDLFSQRIADYVNVRTAISCPFSCSFCGFPQHAGKYQTADVDWIDQQLSQLHRLGVKSVHFIDDTFNVPVKRFKEILTRMIAKKYRFKWHSYFRCQFADRETIEMMKESGCDGVFLGIESGSEQVLKNMNKRSSLQRYLDGISLLNQYGIVTFGSFITGFPGETDETIKDTVKFIETSGLDFYRTQLWYCETITPIWKERLKYRIKGERFEWSHETMNSKTACDRIDEMFHSIKNSLWVPQYDFDFASIWRLVHRGIPLKKVKDFLKGFKMGIDEKLLHPHRTELSYKVFKEMGRIFRQEGDTSSLFNDEENTRDKYNADFNF